MDQNGRQSLLNPDQLNLQSPIARSLLAHFMSGYFKAGRYQFEPAELRQMLDQYVFQLQQPDDELRPEAREALANLMSAGVRPKIISGDDPDTVAALARQLGLGTDAGLVSGPLLQPMDDAAFAAAASANLVFGRNTPQQ